MNFPRKLWKSCLEKTSIVSYNYLGELLKLGGFFFFLNKCCCCVFFLVSIVLLVACAFRGA